MDPGIPLVRILTPTKEWETLKAEQREKVDAYLNDLRDGENVKVWRENETRTMSEIYLFWYTDSNETRQAYRNVITNPSVAQFFTSREA
jgi:hypothetical protein